MRFPELADTLQAVGEDGVGLFYEGALARRISSYMLEMDGIITEQDLAEYEAVIREPMSVSYGAGAMYTNGPPSAGGPTLAQMLKVVSAYDLVAMPDAKYVTARRRGHEAGAPGPRQPIPRRREEQRGRPAADGGGVRCRATAQDLLFLRIPAHHAPLLRGCRWPRRLHHREHGLRVRARRTRHRHPHEQHAG